LQELQASEAEDQQSQALARTWWTRWKCDWGGFIGELKLVLWFCVQLENYQGVFMSQTHSFALVFGSVLYCLGIAAALSDTHAYSLGLRWLLGCDWVVFFGDASFCAYTFQEPVAYVYWWAMRPGAFGTHLPQHWMSPWEFAVFLALLYALAIPFHRYINTPASDWIFEKLTSAFPGEAVLFARTPRSRPHTPVLPAITFRGDAIPTLGARV
jgi:peptidoglycan/LPS O-acetylase OafA/YrhL